LSFGINAFAPVLHDPTWHAVLRETFPTVDTAAAPDTLCTNARKAKRPRVGRAAVIAGLEGTAVKW
jgi:hypothetical protein